MSKRLRAPFPWFGGKSRVAHLVWERFGDVRNFVEPFFGSGAVLLGRPGEPSIETVNDADAYLCLGPETRILRANLSWTKASQIREGDQLIGFDEFNGAPREGLRAPTHYRHWSIATVTAVRRVVKPCYLLTFDDGTELVASGDHLWLGGSHASGGRGWRWQKTETMVCNRTTQRSWVLKVAPVVEREETWDAGWLGGFFDGEGSLAGVPGWHLSASQNPGQTLDRAHRLLLSRGFAVTRSDREGHASSLAVTGGMQEVLRFLMLCRPERLIANAIAKIPAASLYGRSHQAVGLVEKEFLGELETVAITTDTHTFVAEGLASHNCNFWRAVAADPEQVAHYADWPVNEADLHARHRWLVETAAERVARVKTDPEFFDAKVAGWWVWGLCLWIGSGWCARPGWTGRGNAAMKARGVNAIPLPQKMPALADPPDARAEIESRAPATWEQRPDLSSGTGRGVIAEKRPALTGHGPGAGVHRASLGAAGWKKRPVLQHGEGGRGVMRQAHQVPDLSGDSGAAGRGIHASGFTRRSGGLFAYMQALSDRLRRVRICCGDFERVLGPAVTTCIGLTGVFLDPPYPEEGRSVCYAHDGDGVWWRAYRWAVEHGEDPLLRIALCGYEHPEAVFHPGWRAVAWKASGGYGRSARGKANARRERVWFSPGCLEPLSLFDHPATTQETACP